MDKTIWECALYVGLHEVLAEEAFSQPFIRFDFRRPLLLLSHLLFRPGFLFALCSFGCSILCCSLVLGSLNKQTKTSTATELNTMAVHVCFIFGTFLDHSIYTKVQSETIHSGRFKQHELFGNVDA